MAVDFHSYASSNRKKTFLFTFMSFFLFGAILSALCFYFLEPTLAAIVALSVTGLTILYLYTNASQVALTLTRAREVQYADAVPLHNLVDEMVVASGITKPRVFIIEDLSMNAFACGTAEKGNIVFTRGILESLNREELQGVVAHEISHLKNGDSKLMTIVASVGIAIGILSEVGARMFIFGGGNGNNNSSNAGPLAIIILIVGLVGVILAPILAALIQASVSREREWLADATAVDLTRNPVGLRNALEKLAQSPNAPRTNKQTTSHLWIVAPVNHFIPATSNVSEAKKAQEAEKKHKRRASKFDTHPPIEDRIARLRELESS